MTTAPQLTYARLAQLRAAATGNDPVALSQLGTVLCGQGQAEEGLALLERAAALAPDAGDVRMRLARALVGQGQYARAEPILQAEVARVPDSAEWLFELSVLYLATDRPEAAEAPLRAVVAQQPDHPTAHFNLAYVLRRRGALDEALECYARAEALSPLLPGLALSYASAEAQAGRMVAAEVRLRAAVRRTPDDAELCDHFGGLLLGQNKAPEALGWFRRAIGLDPSLHSSRFGLALALLTLGQYREGWAAYEARWEDPEFTRDEPERPAPPWTGEDPAGRTILLHAEQGLGDTLQFLRYVPLVRARGAKVALEVAPALTGLVADLAETVTARGEPSPPHDLRCPLMSLPHVFGTELATIPAEVPYLRAPEAARARWRERLGERPRGERRVPRIGIACSGDPTHSEDSQRSIPAARFLTAFAGIEAELYLLQKDHRPADAEALAGVRAPPLEDFANTAALMELMDLIVSIDSAPAHLAGALGRPAWVLVPLGPDFRWLRERSDSPWYPTLRLFRQTAWQDWSAPLAAVNAALRSL